MRKILAVVVVVALSACQAAPGTDETATEIGGFTFGKCTAPRAAPQVVALSDLTQQPARYEGAFIQISGYYYSYFEHSAIYPTAEKTPYSQDFRRGIWVFGVEPALSGKQVQLTGLFTHTIKGHLDQWPGSLCVTSVTETSVDAP